MISAVRYLYFSVDDLIGAVRYSYFSVDDLIGAARYLYFLVGNKITAVAGSTKAVYILLKAVAFPVKICAHKEIFVKLFLFN